MALYAPSPIVSMLNHNLFCTRHTFALCSYCPTRILDHTGLRYHRDDTHRYWCIDGVEGVIDTIYKYEWDPTDRTWSLHKFRGIHHLEYQCDRANPLGTYEQCSNFGYAVLVLSKISVCHLSHSLTIILFDISDVSLSFPVNFLILLLQE